VFTRTPDIFLSAVQLEARACADKAKARGLRPGKVRDRLLRYARQDETMADMKRLIGEAETPSPLLSTRI